MRARGSAPKAYFVELASMPHKHGLGSKLKTSLLFRRVAETVAGEVLNSHRGATPLIFCDHTVSSLLYFEKSFGDLPPPTNRRECAKGGHGLKERAYFSDSGKIISTSGN
jgi:hypothetical protein